MFSRIIKLLEETEKRITAAEKKSAEIKAKIEAVLASQGLAEVEARGEEVIASTKEIASAAVKVAKSTISSQVAIASAAVEAAKAKATELREEAILSKAEEIKAKRNR